MAQYRKDFLNLFVPTEAFTECEDTLFEHHALMITGVPGSGKTMIAQQLTVKLWDVNKCHPFRVTKPSEYSKNCNPEIPLVFHIDDVFGSSNFIRGKYDAWVSVFGNMKDDLRSNNTYIIFTSRDNILNANLTDLKNFEVFRHVINLSDKRFKLTEENKAVIFENHAEANHFDFKYTDIVEYDQTIDPMGYPQRVRLLCAMRDVTNESRLRYFNRPMEFISSIIGSYREKDHLSYLILILLLMNDGKLPVSFFHESNKSLKQVQTYFDICDVPSTTTMGALFSTANNLCGSFLILIDDVFVYQHESIMEAATLNFGKNCPSDILDRCSLQFLQERVFTKYSAPSYNEFVVILQPDKFLQLCARLVKEIQRALPFEDEVSLSDGEASSGRGDPSSLNSLSSHRIFRDPDFLLVFLRHLQGTDSFHLLFTSSSTDSPHPSFLFFAAASGQDALIFEVLFSYVRYVRQSPGFSDQLDHIMFAACFSGSLVAVKALLGAGARVDYSTASDPFAMRDGQWHGSQNHTTLMHAAYSGSAEVLRLVVDHLPQLGVDVAAHVIIRDNNGKTALHCAAQAGHGAAALKILLDSGADVNAKDNQGQTALHCSAWHGDEGAVRVLLAARAEINVFDSAGSTSLHQAIMWEHVPTARLLVEAGADIHIRSTSVSAFEVAVDYGLTDLVLSLSTVDCLLDRCSMQFLVSCVVTKDSAPPGNKYVVVLQPRCFPQLCARIVKEIRRCVFDEAESLSGDGDPHSLSSLSGCRVFRDPTFPRVFLQHLMQTVSFHLIFTSSLPRSPHTTFMFFAAASGHDALVHEVFSSYLHNVQLLPGFSDHLDRILYTACNSGSPAAVSVLLAAGARADYRMALAPDAVSGGTLIIISWLSWWDGPQTYTTLMHAAYSSSPEVLQLIIDHLRKVDLADSIHIRDDKGRTALHWCARRKGEEGEGVKALQLLLDAGANVNVTDEQGQTSLYYAAEHGNFAKACMLGKHGGDIHIRTALMSPLEIAVRSGNRAIADTLISISTPDVLLDRCSFNFIVSHVFTKDSYPSDTRYVTILRRDKFSQLCVRLVKLIQRYVCSDAVGSPGIGDPHSMMSLSAYRMFLDPAFRHVFLRHLQLTVSFHLLLSSSLHQFPHPTFLFFAAVLGQDSLVHEVLTSYVRDVQLLPGFRDHLDRILYAACYSESPKAVRALLTTGARVDYRTAQTPANMKNVTHLIYGDGWYLRDWLPTCTTLMHAAYSGNAEVLRLVLDHLQQQHVDVTNHVGIRDSCGRTALHWWVQGGRKEAALQILLKAGANVNATDRKGETPLYHAAERGDFAAARLLMEAGADIHIRIASISSLEIAVLDSILLNLSTPDILLDHCSVEFLLKHVMTQEPSYFKSHYGVVLKRNKFPHLCARLVKEIQMCLCAEEDESSNQGDPYSLRSLSSCHLFVDPAFHHDFLHYLQQTDSFRVLFTSSSQLSPHFTFIFFAAALGQDSLISSYLQLMQGFIDHFDRVLYAACYGGRPVAVKALLSAEARADFKMAHNPLYVKELLECDKPDGVRHGRLNKLQTCTTIMHAAYSSSLEVLRLIIDWLQQQRVDVTENVNSRDGDGRTALHWWAQGKRSVAVLHILLEIGADVNAISKHGEVALHKSASSRDEEAVRALLEAGADVNVVTTNGDTPLHWAIDAFCYGTVRLLVEAGADIHRKGKWGSPLHFALRSGSTAIVDILLSRSTPDALLERCSVQFLLWNIVTMDSHSSDSKYVFIMHRDKFSQLCTRLVKEIQACICAESEGSSDKGNAFNGEGKASSHEGDMRSWIVNFKGDPDTLRFLSTHRVFRDLDFLHVFLRHLQQTASFNLLLTSSSPYSPHPTFLFFAAALGQDALVHDVLSSYLFDVQQLPGFSDHFDRALYAACYGGFPAIVRALLAAEARADFKKAIDPFYVKALLADYVPFGLMHARWDGPQTCTTLMHAAYSSSVEVLGFILDHLKQQGVDVVEHIGITDRDGRTALHWWAEAERTVAALQILLEAGANVNASDKHDEVVLHCCALNGDEDAVRALLEAGADVNVLNTTGETPLHRAVRGNRAAEHKYFTTVRLLVEAGADIHMKAKSRSPLQVALRSGCRAIVDILLSRSTPDALLERCSVEFLLWNIVTMESDSSDSNYVFIMHQDQFPQLCMRLVKEIHACIWAESEESLGKGNAFNGEGKASSHEGDMRSWNCKVDPDTLRFLSTHRVFRDLEFLHVFLRHLQQTASFHLLLTSSSPYSPHPTFLFFAAALGQDALVHDVLSSYLFDVQQLPGFSDHFDRALYAACYGGYPAIVRALLAAGARADFKMACDPVYMRMQLTRSFLGSMKHGRWDGPQTCTTLMHAAFSGSEEVMRLIVDNMQQQRVDMTEHVGIRDGDGKTALHWLALGGQKTAALDILLEVGADVHATDNNGNVALYV